MKNVKLILSALFLLSTTVITAQNYGRNNSMNNSRVNQMTTPQNTELENQRRKENYEKEKQKNIENSVEKLKIDLELDELQFIAIKQIINESIKTEGIIRKKEESDEDKAKAISALSTTTDTKIRALLSKTQNEKFTEIKENPKKKRK